MATEWKYFVHGTHFDFRQWPETFYSLKDPDWFWLEHTLRPIHGVLEAFTLEIKRPKREADHSPPCSSKVNNV